jgi:hypothetical protein
MTDVPELLPCPFCGCASAAIRPIRDGMRVSCPACGADGPNVYHGPEGWGVVPAKAAAGWNRRAHAEAMAAEARREALEAAAERLRNYIEQAHYYGRGITPTTAADLQILVGRIRSGHVPGGGSNDKGK